MTGDGADDAAMTRLLAVLSALGGESAQRLREQAAGALARGPDCPPVPAVDTADALRGITSQDRALLEEGLRVIAAWVRRPDPRTGQRVDAVIERMRRELGPLIARDPGAEEAAETERLRASVRGSIALRLKEARAARPHDDC
ncbi:hypothetical protein AB0D98_31150 [Streptomyces sp. NPDC047987]|uniref:hypothetical protein n=1 Tax=unclassified Streptomyces TaxID=2593676 RepID=UPI0034146251